ncbi:hypothetical protein DX903_05050 [Adlercreutzia equolifaciens]|nr:hypothetical protein DX903_05050 [Adlercreutzia equolifaciens]
MLPRGRALMDILETYQVDGWLDFVVSLFAVVPVGFLLALFLGFASFGVFGALRLLRRLIHR